MADPAGDVPRPLSEEGNAEAQRGPVSFGFARTLSRPRAREAQPSTEGEAVSGLEAGEVLSVKPCDRPRPLVIPLIQKNRWHRPKPRTEVSSEARRGGEQEDAEMLSRAVQELIEAESQRQREDPWDQTTFSIPLLMQNQPPSGVEDGERSTAEEYEAVPVQAYGMAMLRGMGWKEGEGIGHTFKQLLIFLFPTPPHHRRDVKPREHQLRPKGLGLGADRSLSRDLDPPGGGRTPGAGRGKQQEEEEQGLCLGATVRVRQGPHRELLGQVQALDPDNARALVRLELGGEVVTVSQHRLDMVRRGAAASSSEGPDPQPSPGGGGQREGELRSQTSTQREPGSVRDRKRRHKDGGSREAKVETGQDIEPLCSPPHRKRGPARDSCWLHPDLQVRLVDRNYMGGAFYNSKVTIEDVLASGRCVCRTDGGRLLEGVTQSMLETVIPKAESNPIMVVRGEHRGSMGRVLQRDRMRCRALVELQQDEGHLLNLDYDQICRYLGPWGWD
ncbi:G-patch domain and KOW motifs-containing protein isoform X3 [Narcine bancroftii]|uniref:G-patch domain and KOW motifs-containing protein isoform X3 n=1 Tax=Narcine bancroftii TaxID=1343680 RepID=UPI00383232C8